MQDLPLILLTLFLSIPLLWHQVHVIILTAFSVKNNIITLLSSSKIFIWFCPAQISEQGPPPFAYIA
jgi:hypothetical protein